MPDFDPVPEAPIAETEHGRAVQGPGWFVLNLDGAVAQRHELAGHAVSFEPAEHRFADTGVNVQVLAPGQPNCKYHGETGQEDFLVLFGEAILVVEEQERRVRQWDFVHCPGGTRHVFIGAGDGPCAILMIGARREDRRVHYPVSELASAHAAGVEVATDLPAEAYADWGKEFTPMRMEWPPR